MIKIELEKAIENGESVWVVNLKNKTITENKRHKHFKKLLATQRENRITFDRIFTTRRQAEHYLHHANVERVEKLPFLTWEEFKGGKELYFTNKSGYPMSLCVVNAKSGKKIGLGGANGYFDLQQIYDLTEANFYKAYNECVRLFKGEE